MHEKLNIKHLITSELLFYSWNTLKVQNKILCDLSKKGVLEPISKVWFKKVAYFIQEGHYNYIKGRFIKSDKFYSKTKFLQLLKNKILENAFLIILKPHFREVFFLRIRILI